MMDFCKVLYFLLGYVACSFASRCQDISGNWTNELGSRLVLDVDSDGRLRGAYQTAVESVPGAAALVSNVLGISSNYSGDSQVAFSVLFNRGSSVASWVGQCMVCDDEEKLYTTYILHSPRQKWPSVVIGQNTFRRPREAYDTIQLLIQSELVNVKTLEGQTVIGKWKAGDEQVDLSAALVSPTGGSNLEGTWRSPSGKEYSVLGIGESSIKGTNSLRQDVEDNGSIALAWMTLAEDRIRSWSGFVSDVPKGQTHTLSTAWLEYDHELNCLNPGGIAKFGMTAFTKTTADQHPTVMKSETFMDKLRSFFTSWF